MRALEVVVLGHPQVRVDGRPVVLQGRLLLLMLRITLSGPLPAERGTLLDAWPDDSGTDGALRVALTRLRAKLGSDVIRRVGHGYVLDPVADVDAEAFTCLVRRSMDPATTRAERTGLLEQALGLWAGDAYAGIEGLPWVDHEIVRLSELHEQSIDRRFELRLHGTDRAACVSMIPELVDAADQHPEREHRTALAATALYHRGRQVDALAVISRTRDALLDRYGLDLGEELSDLELAILRHQVADAS